MCITDEKGKEGPEVRPVAAIERIDGSLDIDDKHMTTHYHAGAYLLPKSSLPEDGPRVGIEGIDAAIKRAKVDVVELAEKAKTDSGCCDYCIARLEAPDHLTCAGREGIDVMIRRADIDHPETIICYRR